MILKRTQAVTLNLLISVAIVSQGQAMEELVRLLHEKQLGIPVTREQSAVMGRNPELTKEAVTLNTTRPGINKSDFLDETIKNPTLSFDDRANRASGGAVLARLGVLSNPANIAEAKHLKALGIDTTVTLPGFNEALRLRALGGGLGGGATAPQLTEALRLQALGGGLAGGVNEAQLTEALRLKALGGGLAGGVNEAQLMAALYLQNIGHPAIIANPNEDEVNGAVAFIAGGHGAPTNAEIAGWVANVPERAARVHLARLALVVNAHHIDAVNAIIAGPGAGAVNANSVPAAHALLNAVGGPAVVDANNLAAAHALLNAVGGPAVVDANNLLAAEAFIAGGHAAPTNAEIAGWVGNVAARAARVHLARLALVVNAHHIAAVNAIIAGPGGAAVNANSIPAAHALLNAVGGPAVVDANNLAAAHALLNAVGGPVVVDANNLAAAHALLNAVGGPVVVDANNLAAAEAFIAGGHGVPTNAEIAGWVANVPERAARVLIGAAGLDATDANLIAATTRAVALGTATDADHITGADHVIRTLAQAAATADQINGCVLLMAAQHGAVPIPAPTLPQVDAVASVPAGEVAMRVETAWGIQAGFGGQLPGSIPVVAKVVVVNGGYHEFELVRTKANNLIANGKGTARLLDNAGALDPAGNRFRVPNADVGGLARHAINDVVVFNRLTAHATPGMVTISDIAQH